MSDITEEISQAFHHTQDHVHELLRGFRSGVAVAEDHLVELLQRLERLGGHLFGVSAPAPEPAPEPAPAPEPTPAPEPAPVEAPATDAPQA